MKKVLLGLVIAVMMTGSGYADNEKTYIDKLSENLINLTKDKYLILDNDNDVLDFKYENICNEIKKEIGQVLFLYIHDRAYIDLLRRKQNEETDPSILSQIGETLDKQIEYITDTEDLSKKYMLGSLISAVCK